MTRPSPAADGPHALVGRAQDVARLLQVLPSAGGGRACLVRGEPGVGKSALLEAVADRAERAGVRLLRIAGAQSEAELAFAGLHQLVLPLESLVKRLSEGQRQTLALALAGEAGEAPDRFLLSSAVLSLLRMAAELDPVLVVVDDVQWLDRSSSEVVGFVVRRLQSLPVSMLLAARSGVRCAIDEEQVPEHLAEPLSPQACAQLLAARFPALAEQTRQRICTEAAGNALALLELPAAFADPHAVAVWALQARLPLTDRLQTVFAGRARHLSEAAQRALLLLALEPLYARRRTDDPVWQQAVEAGLVRRGAQGVEFRHPLVRSALIEAAAPQQVRAAHAELAEVTADDLDVSVWHRAGAAVEPDESVAGALEDAGRRAWRRGGASAAVTALARAAELSVRSNDRARRLTQAAYSAGQSGSADVAEQLLAEARRANAHPAAAAGTARAAQAYLLLQRSGDLDGSLRLLHRTLADSPQTRSPDASGFDETVNVLLYNCLYAARSDTWAAFDAACAALEVAPSDVTQLCIDAAVQPAETADRLRQQLSAIFARISDDEVPRSVVALCWPASVVGCLGEIRDRLYRLLESERHDGVTGTRLTLLINLTHEEIQLGNWHFAQKLVEECRQVARHNDFRLLYWGAVCQQAAIAAYRGDTSTAVRLALEAEAWAAPRRIGLMLTVTTLIRAVAALGDQNAAEAFTLLSRTSPPSPLPQRDRFVHQSLMDWVEAAVRCDRTAEANAHLAAAEDAGIGRISPYLQLLVAGSAALCAPPSRADEAFAVALQLEAAQRYPFEQARLFLAHGQQLRRSRRREEAVDRLQPAFEIFGRLGARRWAATAAAELRAAGLTVTSTQKPDVQGLTAQELLIAQLAARGLSNKQIGAQLDLSPRTIGTHLYKVFPKLGVTSRAALSDALRLAGLDDSTTR